MTQDTHRQAVERYEDAMSEMSETHARMREDFAFSNPADPQQWPDEMRGGRKGRPTETHDQTNQYIAQIVNDARQNSPSIQTLPADSRADPEVSQKLNGLLKHIEYSSRASLAYDTGLEHAVRGGLGWIRVCNEVTDEETGEQEIRIKRVHDPFDALLDASSTEPDGSDATHGFVLEFIREAEFKERWPKASMTGFGRSSRNTAKGVIVADYQHVVLEKEQRVLIAADEGSYSLSVDEYSLKASAGEPLIVLREYTAQVRRVKWLKLNGDDVLESTDFPCQWIGLVPVYGHEMWVDGKRQICGMTRRLMPGQRLHNYGLSSAAEQMLMQPKAPFTVPARAIEGLEQHWAQLNTGNPSHLPFNDIDRDGNPIAGPVRTNPPPFPAAWAQMAEIGSAAMQASVGMYKSNLGMASSATSGKAKMQDKLEGDTANFHYIDNLRRSMEQVGRICVDMIPQVIDSPRSMRIIGADDEHSFVKIDPSQPEAALKDRAGKVVSINPGVGKYDVRVKVGPGYASQRIELNERLALMAQSNPELGAALAPIMVKMADLPEAEKVARVAMALLPPNVQAAYSDEHADIPPEVAGQLQQMQQQLQQAGQMVQQLTAELDAANQHAAAQQAQAQVEAQTAQSELQLKARAQEVDQYNAETNRLKAEAEVEKMQREQQAQAIAAMQAQQAGQEQDGNAIALIPELMQAVQQLMAAQEEVRGGVEAAQQAADAVGQQQQAQAQALASIAETVARPRVVKIVRDETGLATGAVSGVAE